MSKLCSCVSEVKLRSKSQEYWSFHTVFPTAVVVTVAKTTGEDSPATEEMRSIERVQGTITCANQVHIAKYVFSTTIVLKLKGHCARSWIPHSINRLRIVFAWCVCTALGTDTRGRLTCPHNAPSQWPRYHTRRTSEVSVPNCAPKIVVNVIRSPKQYHLGSPILTLAYPYLTMEMS